MNRFVLRSAWRRIRACVNVGQQHRSGSSSKGSGGGLVYISEAQVSELLEWDELAEAIERSLVSVTTGEGIQLPRAFLKLANIEGLMGTMSGFLSGGKGTSGALACKLVNIFSKNPTRPTPLPAIMAYIVLFDDQTGELKCVMGGAEITAWRTAAASVIATKYLHSKRENRQCKILAIIGSGTQGRSHSIAFQNFFKFNEVRILDAHPEKAKALVDNLKSCGIAGNIKAADTVENCVKDADVIVTATFSVKPFLELKFVKKNAHINAVGAGVSNHSELGLDLYKEAWICTDHWAGAETELAGLGKLGFCIRAELGEIIVGKVQLPPADKITVFHSLGMPIEDAAAAKLVFDKHQGSRKGGSCSK